MINYLAMDFGTSNCVAGFLEDTQLGMKLRLIELEGESTMLPSVLFVQQRDLPPLHVSQTLLEIKLVAEELKEEQRIRELELNVRSMVESYQRLNAPRVKRPDPSDFFSSEAYERADRSYREQLKALPAALERFKETELSEYEKELRLQMIKPVSRDLLRKRLKFRLARSISEERSKLLWDKTFFGALLSDDMQTYFGETAIREYSTDPMSGFLMRSPKAFLAAEIRREHREIFIRALTKIFRQVREVAEEATEQSFNGLVVGRPVNFMGTNNQEGNKQAEDIIKESAQRAGYIEVRFVLEPLAAALAIRRKLLDTDDPVVVVDIGGGTTDVAYLEVDRNAEQNFYVRNVFGERIGGNDLDQAIAWSCLAPFIGRGSTFKDGKSIPTTIISAALQTRDIPQQLLFRRSFAEIEYFMQQVHPRDAENIERLYEVLLGQLQHQLVLAAEGMKVRVDSSSAVTQDFDFFENSFRVEFSKENLISSCQDCIDRIVSIIRSSLTESGSPSRPVRVFLTGGMSQSQAIFDCVRSTIPAGSTVERLPAFKAIVGGLAIVANTLNRSSSVLLEPSIVRGIPVAR